jgi:hypothetical protein
MTTRFDSDGLAKRLRDRPVHWVFLRPGNSEHKPLQEGVALPSPPGRCQPLVPTLPADSLIQAGFLCREYFPRLADSGRVLGSSPE